MIDYEKITNFFSGANRKFSGQLNDSRNNTSYFILNSNEKREAMEKLVWARVTGVTVMDVIPVLLKEPEIKRSFKNRIKKLLRKRL